MKRLLERLVGRPSPDERKPAEVAAPAPDARQEPPSKDAGAADSAVDFRESVIQGLRGRLAEMSGGRLRVVEIQEDAPLFDRGYLDSFSYVELLAFIEHTHGVRIDDSQLAGHLGSIAAIADHIVREQTARAL